MTAPIEISNLTSSNVGLRWVRDNEVPAAWDAQEYKAALAAEYKRFILTIRSGAASHSNQAELYETELAWLEGKGPWPGDRHNGR